jgi:hypothetical protein
MFSHPNPDRPAWNQLGVWRKTHFPHQTDKEKQRNIKKQQPSQIIFVAPPQTAIPYKKLRNQQGFPIKYYVCLRNTPQPTSNPIQTQTTKQTVTTIPAGRR